MSNKLSDKDKKDWKSFVLSKDKIINKDLSFEEGNNYKKKIEKIDLHGYSLEDANKKIEKFLYKSFEKGIQKVIVITGKGLRSKNAENPYVSEDLSLLKNSIPEYINQNLNLKKIIKRLEKANIKDGGEGALYVFLKKFKE